MTALSDLRVLDLSTDVAGPFCTKLFADYGADVIKVETPGRGDVARFLGAYSDGAPDFEASSLFLALNTNKRGITLNLASATGRELFKQLVALSDVVVESFEVGKLEEMELGFDHLEAIRPGVILTSITPFGQTGPWRAMQATDLITQATSGLSAVNGLPDTGPLREPGVQTGYQGGACAFLGSMSAICYRDVECVGQHVDIALQEAAATMIAPEITRVAYAGKSPGMRLGFLPCKDGYVTLNVRSDQAWRDFWDFLGNPAAADDQRFRSEAGRREHQAEMEAYMRPYLSQYTMDELFNGLQPKRILVGMALDMPHLLDSAHLNARHFFVEADHPVVGKQRYAGAPFKMSRTPWRLDASAPLLGQHNRAIYGDLLGYQHEDLARWQAEGII